MTGTCRILANTLPDFRGEVIIVTQLEFIEERKVGPISEENELCQ